jgi:hypothetical protein
MRLYAACSPTSRIENDVCMVFLLASLTDSLTSSCQVRGRCSADYGADHGTVGAVSGALARGERQKPGALRRELHCRRHRALLRPRLQLHRPLHHARPRGQASESV